MLLRYGHKIMSREVRMRFLFVLVHVWLITTVIVHEILHGMVQHLECCMFKAWLTLIMCVTHGQGAETRRQDKELRRGDKTRSWGEETRQGAVLTAVPLTQQQCQQNNSHIPSDWFANSYILFLVINRDTEGLHNSLGMIFVTINNEQFAVLLHLWFGVSDSK